MKVQNIGNQPSFKAHANFIPLVPENIRGLITSKRFKNATGSLKDLYISERLDARCIMENLHEAIRNGVIKRSLQVISPPQWYKDARVFELNGDRLVLCSKPDLSSGSVGSSSKIEIQHVANGPEGTTHIFRNHVHDSYAGINEDPEFDALAEALNELKI
jgi:hypothetical protein